MQNNVNCNGTKAPHEFEQGQSTTHKGYAVPRESSDRSASRKEGHNQPDFFAPASTACGTQPQNLGPLQSQEGKPVDYNFHSTRPKMGIEFGCEQNSMPGGMVVPRWPPGPSANQATEQPRQLGGLASHSLLPPQSSDSQLVSFILQGTKPRMGVEFGYGQSATHRGGAEP